MRDLFKNTNHLNTSQALAVTVQKSCDILEWNFTRRTSPTTWENLQLGEDNNNKNTTAARVNTEKYMSVAAADGILAFKWKVPTAKSNMFFVWTMVIEKII